MLPGRDGFGILRTLRKAASEVRILVLRARDAVQDHVARLDGGAGDYLVKPFAFPVLLAGQINGELHSRASHEQPLRIL